MIALKRALALVGVFGMVAVLWSPAPAQDACPAGQVRSIDTHGRCCWPGQGWNGQTCVGKPTACPPMMRPDASGCVEEFIRCTDGRVPTYDMQHCCWPGQAWSAEGARCIGPPSQCPDLYLKDVIGEDCVLTAEGREVQEVQKSCMTGDGDACATAGLWIERGEKGQTPNEMTAVSFYKMGCDGGSHRACTSLGSAYLRGAGGLPRDTARGVALYRTACDGGLAAACLEAGRWYRDHDGPEQDPELAAALLKQACKRGLATACQEAQGM